MTSKSVAIGIDLGTTYSCVALFKNGQVEVIANEHGNRTTPSYVAFTDNERLVGDAAKSQAGTNPANTIFDTKRLVGRKFGDTVVQEDMLNWPFEIVNKEGKPQIKVTFKNEVKLFMPEQISAMILEKMKQTAVNYCGSEIKKVVVTVPAYFNDAQRQATKDAAKIAGLETLRIVNEPTAAGIAYGFRSQDKTKKNILVFDFGGGTFDVSILTIDDGVYEVKSTAGDTHLGGEDCDTNLVNHFLKEIKRRFNKDLTNNKKAMYRLRSACEKMKRNLATSTQASIDVDSLFDGQDFKSNISKARFDEINNEVYEKLKSPINKALEDADMEPKEIDSIVSVGGSSRITYVNGIIADIFRGKEMEKDINPDEAVAIGAAILAAHLNGDEHESLKNFHLKDVTPLSLGIEVVGGQMEVLIERNTITPASETKIFTTNFEDQNAVSIVVYEGERPLVKDNNKLGEFVINGIPPAQREVPKIEVTFEIDKDGILKVSGVDKRNEETQKEMTIENDSGRLSEPEIRRLIQDAVKFREDDEKEQLRVRSKLELEDYCLDAKSKIIRAKGKLTQKETETVKKYCDDCLEWLEDHESEDIESYMRKFRSLQSTFDSILSKC